MACVRAMISRFNLERTELSTGRWKLNRGSSRSGFPLGNIVAEMLHRPRFHWSQQTKSLFFLALKLKTMKCSPLYRQETIWNNCYRHHLQQNEHSMHSVTVRARNPHIDSSHLLESSNNNRCTSFRRNRFNLNWSHSNYFHINIQPTTVHKMLITSRLCYTWFTRNNFL